MQPPAHGDLRVAIEAGAEDPVAAASLVLDAVVVPHETRADVVDRLAPPLLGDAFGALGEADLTAHVDFGALRQAGEAAGLTFAGLTTQGALLASLDMGDLLVGLGRDPATTAAEYVAAQAATIRLIDPGGMGRFRALLMSRDAPVEPPLRGLRERGPAF